MKKLRLSENKKIKIERLVKARSLVLQEQSKLNINEDGWWDTIQDVGQAALGVAGMTPLIGFPADLVNSAWSAGRGNYGDAALNLAAAVPGAGLAVGGANLTNKAIKAIKGVKAVKNVLKTPYVAYKGGKGLMDLSNQVGTVTPYQAPNMNFAADVDTAVPGGAPINKNLYKQLSVNPIKPTQAGGIDWSQFSK